MSILELKKAFEREAEARREIDRIVKASFPVGAKVQFEGSRSLVYPAIVKMHGYDGRLCVVNEYTGRERWIDPQRLR